MNLKRLPALLLVLCLLCGAAYAESGDPQHSLQLYLESGENIVWTVTAADEQLLSVTETELAEAPADEESIEPVTGVTAVDCLRVDGLAAGSTVLTVTCERNGETVTAFTLPVTVDEALNAEIPAAFSLPGDLTTGRFWYGEGSDDELLTVTCEAMDDAGDCAFTMSGIANGSASVDFVDVSEYGTTAYTGMTFEVTTSYRGTVSVDEIWLVLMQ